jgi:SAM-dependent methyltransferase
MYADAEYEEHQGQKLKSQGASWIKKWDANSDPTWDKSLKWLRPFVASPVLCVGARVGGEVRAFSRLVDLAVGIDLYPGEKNPFVMYGDAHKLQFNNASFRTLFTNVLDHILYVDKFASEARRVLKPNGVLITSTEIGRQAAEKEQVHCPKGCGFAVRNTYLEYPAMNASLSRYLRLRKERKNMRAGLVSDIEQVWERFD